MVTNTEKIYVDLFDLLTLYMSARAAKHALSYFIRIERTRGFNGLKELIANQVSKILELHLSMSREELIHLENTKKGFNPLRGPLGIFFKISLRNGCRGGLSLALMLLDYKGHLYAPKPDNKAVRQKANKLRGRIDPYEEYDPRTGVAKRTPEGKKILKKYLSYNLPQATRTWLGLQRGKELVFAPYPTQANKRQMIKFENNSFRTHAEVIPSELVQALDQCPDLVWRNYDYVKYVIGDLLPDRQHFIHLSNQRLIVDEDSRDVVGRIYPLNKDRGMKVRDVFPPIWAINLLLSPLHRRLKLLLKARPGNFCHDQEGGMEWVAEQLRAGRRVSSIDISSASDNIPLSPQIELLRIVLADLEYRDQIVDIFYSACRSKWLSPFDLRTFVIMLYGSVMGLEGVYDSFTTLLHVEGDINKIPPTDYVLVGDDLVSLSKHDATWRRIFDAHDIPLSLNKCIWDSDRLAEFCGRLITSNGPLGKMKSSALDLETPNPRLMMEKYGHRILKRFTLSPKEKRLVLISHEYHNNPTFLDTIQEEKAPVYSIGGYTPTQYYRMGLMSRKAYLSLLYLVRVYYSSGPEYDLESILDRYFFIKWRLPVSDENGNNYKLAKYKVRTHLPVSRQGFSERSFMATFYKVDIPEKRYMDLKGLIEDNLSVLYAKAQEREYLHIRKSKPVMSSRLKMCIDTYAVQNCLSKDDPVSEEEIALADFLKDADPETTSDVLKSTVIELGQKENLPFSSLIPVEVDQNMIEPPPLVADVKHARKVEINRRSVDLSEFEKVDNQSFFGSLANSIAKFFLTLVK